MLKDNIIQIFKLKIILKKNKVLLKMKNKNLKKIIFNRQKSFQNQKILMIKLNQIKLYKEKIYIVLANINKKNNIIYLFNNKQLI